MEYLLRLDYHKASDKVIANAPLANYCTEFQNAFLKNIDQLDEIKVGDSGISVFFESITEKAICSFEHYGKPIESGVSPEVHEVRYKFIQTLETSIYFKAFVAAWDNQLFMEYFPKLSRYSCEFKCSSYSISKVVLQQFPGLKKGMYQRDSNGGNLLDIIESAISLSEEYQRYQRRDLAEEDLIIRLLVLHWKCTSLKSLHVIIDAVDRFARLHKGSTSLYNPELHLTALLDDFPENAVELIELTFRKAVDEIPSATPRDIMLYFCIQTFPLMIAFKHVRRQKQTGVLEAVHAKILALLKDAECYDDFWDLHIIPEPKLPKLQNLPKKLPSAEEKLAVKMSHLVLQNADLCPNCLNKHKLLDCTNLKKDSRDNIAGYFVADYEAHTNRTRMPFMVKCSKRLAKARPQLPKLNPKTETKTNPKTKKKVAPNTPQEPPRRKLAGFNLVSDSSINITSVQQEFIISFTARSTVTYKREFISALKPCTDLIFEDDEGVKHQSREKGTIEIGGITIPCYWAQTLHMSVIGFTDIKNLGSSIMISSDDEVHVCPKGLNVLKCIGVGRYGHLFWTRDVTGKDNGFEFKVEFTL